MIARIFLYALALTYILAMLLSAITYGKGKTKRRTLIISVATEVFVIAGLLYTVSQLNSQGS